MTPKLEARRAMALTLAFDVVAAGIAMAVAIAVRWQMDAGAPPNALFVLALSSGVFAASAAVAFIILRVHTQVWRHSGWPDAVRIIQAAVLAMLLFLPVIFLWNRLVGFPRSSLIIALPLWSIVLFAGRMFALSRSTHQPLQIFRAARRDAQTVILTGDAEAAADVLRTIDRTPGGARVRVLGLIEIESLDPGRAIRGVPVMGGLDELGKVLDLLTVRYRETPWIAAVGVAREHETMSRILEAASARGSKVMALGSGDDADRLQQVRTADLLSRPARKLDIEPVRDLIRGARVFVTGAGGTIGSELAQQCAELDPAELFLFDASELNLYEVDLFLRERFPDLPIKTLLGNVRDEARIGGALEAARPNIVIHAAALKHVPLMEANSCEAILTNIGGALKTARASAAAGVERFVLISTDKAVDPDNVMGATKRLSEIAISRVIKNTGMAASMVRFGNVLGSSGSVVPLFNRQIARGGPVTVTSAEMSRYFMTVEEASALVLQAATLQDMPGKAELYVLDMGEPVLIQTLAESMIRLKGLVPGRDIRIEYSGPRPGEKLHETLTYAYEAVSQSAVEGVLNVTNTNGIRDDFEIRLETLLNAAEQRDRDGALKLLAELVEGYAANGVHSDPSDCLT
ncbi:MAG: nucleoside-diphosphate sugar epimerase/dehydratase [Hyphomonadaceae bacterium]